jgi:hypothetical protein
VIIDTVSRALAGGNENAPDDMGAFVTALDAMRERLGCTVIAVHHVGKDASRGSRGHSALQCAVDTEIEVEKCEDVSVATVKKQRDGPDGAEYAFRLKSVTLGMDEDRDIVTRCVVKATDVPEKPLNEPAQKGLEALQEMVAQNGLLPNGEGIEVKAWDDKMKELFGTDQKGRTKKARAKKELKEKRYVELSPAGDRVWPITQNAHKAGGYAPG